MARRAQVDHRVDAHTSRASISSLMRIEPSSATIPVPTFAAIHVAERVRDDLAQVDSA